MVFFTCNHCGTCLKKNRVDKHRWECRKPIFVSCHDCLKDFRDQEYDSHTQCITEEEKYSGKDFVPKPSAKKGSLKQQAWVQMVREIQQKEHNLSNYEKTLLETVSKHENIPKKKPQFINFITNIFHKSMPQHAILHVWDLLQAKKSESAGITNTGPQTQKENSPSSKLAKNQITDCENTLKSKDEDSGAKLKKDLDIEHTAKDDEFLSDTQNMPRKKKHKKRSGVVEDKDDVPKKKVKVNSSEPSDDKSGVRVCIRCGASEKIPG